MLNLSQEISAQSNNGDSAEKQAVWREDVKKLCSDLRSLVSAEANKHSQKRSFADRNRIKEKVEALTTRHIALRNQILDGGGEKSLFSSIMAVGGILFELRVETAAMIMAAGTEQSEAASVHASASLVRSP